MAEEQCAAAVLDALVARALSLEADTVSSPRTAHFSTATLLSKYSATIYVRFKCRDWRTRVYTTPAEDKAHFLCYALGTLTCQQRRVEDSVT